MTKIGDRAQEIADIMYGLLRTETGRTANSDVERIIVCHRELSSLHHFVILSAPWFIRRRHSRAIALHGRAIRLWTAPGFDDGLLKRFGDDQSLQWMLHYSRVDDHGGRTRQLANASERALAYTMNSQGWVDRDYAWRAPDLPPHCTDGTCR
jgi:hypothetical protein